MMALQVGMRIDRETLIRKFVSMQYNRNDVDFSRGNFRVRGDTIEIIPVYEELAIRIEMFGDEIEALYCASSAHRRGRADARCRVGVPRLALRGEPGRRCSAPSSPFRTNSPSGFRNSSARASCSRPSGSGCAPPSTWR